jgi:hypothetical protein
MAEMNAYTDTCGIESIDQVDKSIVDAARAQGITDTAETLVFARQLEVIRSKTYEKQYSELKGRKFVPVTSEAGLTKEFVTTRIFEGYVMAKVVSDYSTDYPLVTAAGFEVTSKFHTIGDAYSYTIMEMMKARDAGVPLSEKYATLAKRGIELGIDDMIAVGVPQAKTFGLINNPNVSLQTLPNGTWASATSEQILADLNALVTQMWTGTLELYAPDTILMSTAAYRLISIKLLNAGNSSNITVLEAFKKQNPGISVESWTKLNTANAAGTNGRIIAYKRSDEVLEFQLGADFTILGTEQSQMKVTTYCIARGAGVSIHLPFAIIYSDNQNI